MISTPYGVIQATKSNNAGVLFTVLYRNKELPKIHGRRDLNLKISLKY